MLWERKILLEKEMQVWTSVGEGAPGCVEGANPFPLTARHAWCRTQCLCAPFYVHPVHPFRMIHTCHTLPLLLISLQEVLDPTVGQDVVGEMRREIHRMELRHGELMRLQVRGRHFFSGRTVSCSGRTLSCLDIAFGEGCALHEAACCRWSV